MRAILLVVLVQIIKLSFEQTCTNGILCKTSTDYVLCTITNGQIKELSRPMSCPSGQVCNADDQFVCVASTTALPTTTPTLTTTPSISSCQNNIICKSSTTYALCTIRNGKVVELSSPQSCPNGLICDASDEFGCVGSSLTTTLGASPTSTPARISTSDATLPSSTSDAPLPSSTPGTILPLSLIRASNFLLATGSTAAPTTTGVTTTPAPTTQFACSANGNFAGPQCNQYYRCVFVMWWWDRQLFTCPTGQGFNATAQACVTASQVNCTVQ